MLAWATSQPLAAQVISAITVLELEMGILRKERQDAAQGAILRFWLDGKVLPMFADRVLEFDQVAAIKCAKSHIPDVRAERDALIAATAIVHGMTVVTRNTADFSSTGVSLFNAWIASQ